MRLEPAGTILNDALLELGLVSAELADPYASTDQNVVSCRAHLKSLGRSLAREHGWSQLQRTYEVILEAGENSYQLPIDFVGMFSRTEWNRNSALPLIGPLTPQEWQVLLSAGTYTPTEYTYRIFGNQFQLRPTPSAEATLVFEYSSAYWVQPAANTIPNADKISASTDIPWFDSHLLVCGVKVRFLEAKGFDSTAARVAYERALAQAMGNDGPARVLNLSGRGRAPVPRLPETNWGG